jgi:DNA adenine methylase
MTVASASPHSARPFLRWAGGKQWLAPQLCPLLPAFRPRQYFEPFLGSGAVFFTLRHGRAILSDVNAELINSYKAVRDDPHALIDELQGMENTPASYAHVRASEPTTSVSRAARFLYLNRLGFSGLYRVNQQGKFNVPYGGDRQLDFFWRSDRLLSASEVLAECDLRVADFEDVLSGAGHHDLVYCDPVYLSSSGFRRYTPDLFDSGDLERLFTAIDHAVRRGAVVMLSWPDALDLPELGHAEQHHCFLRQSTMSARAKIAVLRQEMVIVFSPARKASAVPRANRRTVLAAVSNA